MRNGLEWRRLEYNVPLHSVEAQLKSIVKDLLPLFEHFYHSAALPTYKRCGAVHPGKG